MTQTPQGLLEGPNILVSWANCEHWELISWDKSGQSYAVHHSKQLLREDTDSPTRT